MSPTIETTVEFKDVLANQHQQDCFDVTCQEVLEHKESIQVVDVRTNTEFKGELGHIDGAILNTLDDLPTKLKDLDKSKTTVFVCRSGGRSTQATLLAKEKGFTSCFNMQGGMLAWNELGLEITKA